MFLNGYYELDGVTFVDFETLYFSNSINEMLYVYNDNKYMVDELNKLWEKFKDKNKPYVISLWGNDGIDYIIFSRENVTFFWDGDKKPKNEKIKNFDEFINKYYEIDENKRLIEILLNNSTLCANGW